MKKKIYLESHSSVKKQAFRNKQVKKAYDELESEFALIEMIIAKRIERGMTQSQLAKKMGTKQSAISRLEGGDYNPSLDFLKKLSKALDAKMEIIFN